MIAVADINTLWRKKPFEALSLQMPVLGLAPIDFRMAWRRRQVKHKVSPELSFPQCNITLPPGWASKWTRFAAWHIWNRASQMAHNCHTNLYGMVVTSPHYLDLIRKAQEIVPTFYYCSDDYSMYAGWGGNSIVERENQLIRLVNHSFFVSQALADRAITNSGVSADRVSVSPNATENSFFQDTPQSEIQALLNAYPTLNRPLVGVIGGINERLDFGLIAKCASLRSVGSVVMVGNVDSSCKDDSLAALQRNPRCLFVGQRPHYELPVWMQALDVAFIPYRDTPLNQACSPMRLFDHLASGKPIVATHWCSQVGEFGPYVAVGSSHDEVLQLITSRLTNPWPTDVTLAQRELATNHTWDERAKGILTVLKANDISVTHLSAR